MKRDMTVQEIALYYEVHPDLVTEWQKQALSILADGFSRLRSHEEVR